LVEGRSKKTDTEWMGRTDGNKIAVFPKGNFLPGDLVEVEIIDATANTLIGNIAEYYEVQENATELLQVSHVEF